MRELSPKQKERDFLYEAFDSIWSAILQSGAKNDFITGLEMYGSAINGLAIRGNSDLDMTVFMSEDKNDKQSLKSVRQCLEAANRDSNFTFSEFNCFTASFG